MSEPLRYLDEMERVQRDLGRVLSEVEAELAEARALLDGMTMPAAAAPAA